MNALAGLDIYTLLTRPEQRLVVGLQRSWDPDQAFVLADWCEEHGLDGAAWGLRHGPSAEARAVIDSLAVCMGFASPVRRVDWSDEWLGEQYESVDAYTGEQIQAAPAFMRPYLLGSKFVRRRTRPTLHRIIDFPSFDLAPSAVIDFYIRLVDRARVIALVVPDGGEPSESLSVVQINAPDRSLLRRPVVLSALIDDASFFVRNPVVLEPDDDFVVHIQNDSPHLADVRLQAVVEVLDRGSSRGELIEPGMIPSSWRRR